jgi:diguanylate cyclase (GGDEF)-like protein/PAS domain S-box-containing protein
MQGLGPRDPLQGNDDSRAEDARFRQLVEQSQVVTFVQRTTGTAEAGGRAVEYVSPQVFAMLGYTPEEVLSDPDQHHALIHVTDRERVSEALKDSLSTGDPFAEQYRMVRKDGRIIWIDEHAAIALDTPDRTHMRQGTLQDITQQKQAEQALRAGERRFRAIFDDAAVGIARIALDGWILEANDALAELLGRGRVELVGSYLGTFSESGGADGVPSEFTQLAEGGIERYEADRAYVRRDGQPLWCHVAVSLIRDEDLLPEFAIAMFEDITARKAAEDELARRAMHDGLTGLPNRDLLLDRLGVALARTVRGSGIAVMFMDLDGFKGVNDEHGHEAGDVVLIEAGRRFADALRAADTLARHGGDEFVVLLEDVHEAADAVATAERLIHCLDEPIELSNATKVSLGVSIGLVVAFDLARGAEELIRQADTAMYRAKQGGYERVAVST